MLAAHAWSSELRMGDVVLVSERADLGSAGLAVTPCANEEATPDMSGRPVLKNPSPGPKSPWWLLCDVESMEVIRLDVGGHRPAVRALIDL